MLASENIRSLLAFVPLTLTTVLSLVGAFSGQIERVGDVPLLTMFGWIGFCVLYTAMTLWAFLPLGPEDLRAAIPSKQSRWNRWLTGTGNYGSFVAQVSVVALGAALVALLLPDPTALRQVTALVLAVASWVQVVVSTALGYARLHLLGDVDGNMAADPAGPHFSFRQPEPPAFGDFVTLATAIQSAFSSPGVEITSRPARRMVVHQCVAAFVFNTLIIAVLVALLLGMAGH